MSSKNKEYLKGRFANGCVPDETDFEDLLDSGVNKQDDVDATIPATVQAGHVPSSGAVKEYVGRVAPTKDELTQLSSQVSGFQSTFGKTENMFHGTEQFVTLNANADTHKIVNSTVQAYIFQVGGGKKITIDNQAGNRLYVTESSVYPEYNVDYIATYSNHSSKKITITTNSATTYILVGVNSTSGITPTTSNLKVYYGEEWVEKSKIEILEDSAEACEEDIADIKQVCGIGRTGVPTQLINGDFSTSAIGLAETYPVQSIVSSVENSYLNKMGIDKMATGLSGRVFDASAGEDFELQTSSKDLQSTGDGTTIAGLVFSAASSTKKVVRFEFYVYSKKKVWPLTTYPSNVFGIQIAYKDSSGNTKYLIPTIKSFTEVDESVKKVVAVVNTAQFSSMASITAVHIFAGVKAAENTTGIVAYEDIGIAGIKVATFATLSEAENSNIIGTWETTDNEFEVLGSKIDKKASYPLYGKKFYSLGDSIAYQQMWQHHLAKMTGLAYQSAATTHAQYPLGVGGSTICPKIVLTTSNSGDAYKALSSSGVQLTDSAGNPLWFETGKAPGQSIYARSKYFQSQYSDAEVVVINAGQNDLAFGREFDSCDSLGNADDSAYQGLEYVETKYAAIAQHYSNVAIYDDGTLDRTTYPASQYTIITSRPSLIACVKGMVRNICAACPNAIVVGNSIHQPQKYVNGVREAIPTATKQKHDSIVSAYNIMAIPVANMWDNLGANQFNMLVGNDAGDSYYYKNDSTGTTKTYIHPNDLGGQRMARVISKVL